LADERKPVQPAMPARRRDARARTDLGPLGSFTVPDQPPLPAAPEVPQRAQSNRGEEA
jgi:hypothetical protein